MRPERLIALLIVLVATAALAVIVWLVSDPGPVASPSGSEPPAEAVAGRVTRVSDGDTIVVEMSGVSERVRYIGLDAPEIAHPDEGTLAECGGEAARALNAQLVDGREVRLERDHSDRDRFGRLLRHVWVQSDAGWLLAGERLVRLGAADARSFPPDTGRDRQLDAAEEVARQERLGIWATC